MSANRHLFYNGKSLATIKADGSHTRLVGANGMPLSQMDSGQVNAYLLAINEAKSILAAHQAHETRQIAYSPYGGQAASDHPIKLGYNGEPRDAFGFYLLGNGNRAYSPSLMRFLSPDRIGVFLPGNFNSYAYVAGDPVNRIDPSGNKWAPLKKFEVKAQLRLQITENRRAETQQLLSDTNNEIHLKSKQLTDTHKMLKAVNQDRQQQEELLSNTPQENKMLIKQIKLDIEVKDEIIVWHHDDIKELNLTLSSLKSKQTALESNITMYQKARHSLEASLDMMLIRSQQ